MLFSDDDLNHFLKFIFFYFSVQIKLWDNFPTNHNMKTFSILHERSLIFFCSFKEKCFYNIYRQFNTFLHLDET